jgi:hypothetical protein
MSHQNYIVWIYHRNNNRMIIMHIMTFRIIKFYLSPVTSLLLGPDNCDRALYLNTPLNSLPRSSISTQSNKEALNVLCSNLCTFSETRRHYMLNFRLPLTYKRSIHSSGILCGLEWQFIIDILGQPIYLIFKGQTVQENFYLNCGKLLKHSLYSPGFIFGTLIFKIICFLFLV